MRKRVWIPGGLILTICVLLLLFRNTRQQANTSPVVMETNQLPKTESWSSSVPIRDQVPQPGAQHQNPSISTTGMISGAVSATLEKIQQRALADWQRSIEFYGKVIDENSNAIPDAQVSFHWMETLTDDGSRSSNAKSDSEGFFTLRGAFGPSLSVSVSKEGYFASNHGQWGFSYSHGDFSPDPRNPMIFLLHRKGQGAELITSEHGLQLKVDVRVPRNETPIRVDLLQKKPSANGQLEISQNKPPWRDATNWSFRLNIPNGGIVENHEEFQFEAPEKGYQPAVEYRFAKSETNWTTQVTKQFYIVFGQPRKYGWLRIESNLAQETVFLTYAINPNGSRNLEPEN